MSEFQVVRFPFVDAPGKGSVFAGGCTRFRPGRQEPIVGRSSRSSLSAARRGPAHSEAVRQDSDMDVR